MRSYPTRKERQTQMITDFLENPNQKTMQLRLYSREIRGLSAKYPQINIERGKQYLDTDLYSCTIRK